MKPSITLNLADAIRLSFCAMQKALQMNVPICCTVVDAGAHPIMVQRMDGAPLISIKASRRKAYTAVMMRMPSAQVGELVQAGKPLQGLELLDPDLATFGGGIPILRDGQLIGSIGISGGGLEEDVEIAQFALTNGGVVLDA